jgi:hypothetical protein
MWHGRMEVNSLWLKSRKPMRREFESDSRRRNEAVLTKIRASLDNEEAGSKTQAAGARLLPQAVTADPGRDHLHDRASELCWPMNRA